MKKLMVLAAIATVAISSQAANWVWNMNGSSLMYAYGSTTESKTALSGVTAYLFAYVDATSQAAVFNQWYNEGKYGVTELTGAVTGRDSKPETKVFNNGQVAYDNEHYEFQTADTQKKFFFALIDDKGNLFISSTKSASVSQMEGGALLSFSAQAPSLKDNGALTAYSSAGWYTQAVPEPTSALLMLLGVAGLALRRRRA